MLHKLRYWVGAAVVLVFIVVLLGAYTRLKDAGLGCPDWPGCYGELLVPAPRASLPNLEIHKAWIEMLHRYVAGTLGILVLIITIKSIQARSVAPKLWVLSSIILSLVIFQALLGMWTVTLGLYPVVVMGHLLGGLAILSLLWLLYLNTNSGPNLIANKPNFKILASVCLLILIMQIALGGWTSANYAALVCADFPTCQGSWWPAMDWRSAFNVTAVGIFDSPGTPLENTARVTIQMFHRLGAIVTAIFLTILSYQLFNCKQVKLRRLGISLFLLLTLQILLGISNILLRLPLVISLMHNAIAAMLLILMVTILFNLYAKNRND